MKLLKSKFTRLYLINILLISFLFVFGGQNYSVDSYGILVNGYVSNIMICIGNYRFFGGLLYGLLGILGHNPILNCTFDICFFILTVSAAFTALTLKFYDTYEKKSLLSLAVTDISLLISICNVWFCDILSFPECIFIAAIAIILTCSAVILLINSQRLLNCILASVCMILATGIFQQFIALFMIYMIAYCCVVLYQKETNSIKEMLKIFVKPAIIVLTSGIIYTAIAFGIASAFEFVANNRMNLSLGHIFDTAVYLLKKQHSYLKGRGFFETEFLTLSYIVVVLTWFICLIVRAYKKKEFKKVLVFACAVAFAYCCTYAVSLVSVTTSRSLFVVFSSFFLISTGIATLCSKKSVASFVAVLLFTVFCANAFKIVNAELTLKEINGKDIAWANAILDEIDNYEKKSGISVKFVTFYDDANCNGNNFASNTPKYAEGSAVSYSPARKSILNAISGDNHFTVIPKQYEVFNEHFANKDWDEFNAEEQLFFDGDTLHICCY